MRQPVICPDHSTKSIMDHRANIPHMNAVTIGLPRFHIVPRLDWTQPPETVHHWGMLYIPLSKSLVAQVDDADFEWLSQWKWYAKTYGVCKTHYAVRNFYLGKIDGDYKEKFVAMHRLIMGAAPGQCVDHIDGDGLNNRRENLRIASRSQNGWNLGVRKTNTSGYKGVSWNKQANKWQANVRFEGKLKYLGLHQTAEAAHEACVAFREANHGAFARSEDFIKKGGRL